MKSVFLPCFPGEQIQAEETRVEWIGSNSKIWTNYVRKNCGIYCDCRSSLPGTDC
jgi:hypothetical protein